MSLLALCGFLVVLSGSLPTRDPLEAEVTRYEVSDMRPGEYRLLEWQKKPLYIVYRKPEWESVLLTADAELYRDPTSKKSVQPEGFINPLRSVTAGWFVSLGLGTGTGCVLNISLPEPGTALEANGNESTGSFTDGCDQSRYDLSGRVYRDQAARRNTVVPNWRLDKGVILVSE